jgi:hypothetical protein
MNIENLKNLNQFYGSDNAYRHGPYICYTDGVKFLADNADCYWFIDIIASVQHKPKVKAEEFQVWTLSVKGCKGKVVCDDGDDHEVYTQRISFTDFPLPEIKLFCVNTDAVGAMIMLPSEY